MKIKSNKYMIYTLLACLIIITSLLPFTSGIMNNSTPKTSVVHPIIDISGDIELDNFCNSSGTDGLSWATAHVIENYEIDGLGGSACIFIYDTTRYLIIRNCEVYNVAYVAFFNAGIYIWNCQNINVTGCYAYNCIDAGIYARNSNNINISKNTVKNSYGGIGLISSEYCLVSNNVISDNTLKIGAEIGFGISLYKWQTYDNNVSNNIVMDNVIENCAGDGILMCTATSNNVTDNTINDNGRYGIRINAACTNNEIHNNQFCNNAEGMILDEGTGNNMSGNTECAQGIPGYTFVWLIGIIMSAITLISLKIIITRKRQEEI